MECDLEPGRLDILAKGGRDSAIRGRLCGDGGVEIPNISLTYSLEGGIISHAW